MTPEESRKLIEAAGGNKAFAMQIGMDVTTNKKYAFRISNWKKRGIPPKVELDHAVAIKAIKVAATRRGAL